MFKFNRAKILPRFFAMGIPIAKFAQKANVSFYTAERALQGERVSAPVINKISRAMEIDAVEFLEPTKPIKRV